MPTLKLNKESLDGPSKIPDGIYNIRFDGFQPKPSKKGDSVNLNPVLKIINNPDLHDKRIYENLNTKADWIIRDMCHALGVEVGGSADDPELPGQMLPENETDPTKWQYSGPLTGEIATVEVGTRQGDKGTFSAIKRYICRIPGCTVRHPENLL